MLGDTLRLMIDRAQKTVPTAGAAGIARPFILESLLLAPSFKDKAFRDEEEVRLQVPHIPESGP